MGGFASTFAPIENESEGLKLALDLLGLGFAMFASPMWNSGTSLLWNAIPTSFVGTVLTALTQH